MKKLLYTLLAVSIIFSACNKDNDITNGPFSGGNDPLGSNNTSGTIVGSWDLTEYHGINAEGYYLGGYPNGTKVITDSQDDILLPGDTSWGIESATWTFSSDGYLTETVIDENGYSDGYTYGYEKNGNTLTIDTNTIWSIITLSSSKLTVNSISEDTMTYYWDPNNDTVYFYEWNLTLKWDRLSFTTDNSTSKRIQSNKDSFFKTFIDRRKKR